MRILGVTPLICFIIGHIYHSFLPHDNVVVGFRVSLAARTVRVPALDIVLRDRAHPDRVLHYSLLRSGSDCEATEDQRIPVRDARPLPPLAIPAPYWLEAVLSQPMRTRVWRGRGGRGPGPGTGLRRSDRRGLAGRFGFPALGPDTGDSVTKKFGYPLSSSIKEMSTSVPESLNLMVVHLY